MSTAVYDMHADYEAFVEDLVSILEKHAGEHVVYHEREAKGFFASFADAVQFGDREYGMEKFIVQEVVSQEPQVLSYSLLI